MATLDRAQYGRYSKVLQGTINGFHAKWSGLNDLPSGTVQKVRTTIYDQIRLLVEDYDVEFTQSPDGDYIYLDVKVRVGPSGADVLQLESIMQGLMIATRWGGPG